MAMQVRYINAPMGYTGKWMDVKTEKQNDTSNNPNAEALEDGTVFVNVFAEGKY
jgi:hypothetical protein